MLKGIRSSEITTNLLHLGEMYRSVAKRTSPNPFFASRRDATKRVLYQKAKNREMCLKGIDYSFYYEELDKE